MLFRGRIFCERLREKLNPDELATRSGLWKGTQNLLPETLAQPRAQSNVFHSKKPPISVSYHPEKSVAVKTFRPRDVSSLDNLADIVGTWVWSPIIYKDHLRHKDNFLSAGWIGLDVDDGMSLHDAICLLKEFNATAIVGTTASHQKSKDGKAPRDRFRIILEMVDSCTDCELFEYNVRSWRRIFSGDTATTDGARLFKPSTVVFAQEGITQDWLKFPPDYQTAKQLAAKKYQEKLRHQKNRTIPNWILKAQSEGVAVGCGAIKGRHHVCYKIGATLTEFGYSVDEITEFLCAGPLISIGERDVRRQVECGSEKAVRSSISF